MSEVIIKDQLEGDLIFNTGLCNKIVATFFTKFKAEVLDVIPKKCPFVTSVLPEVKAGGLFVLSQVCIDIGTTPILPLISDIVWLRGEYPLKSERPTCDDVSIEVFIEVFDVANNHVVGVLRISLKCLEQVLARL